MTRNLSGLQKDVLKLYRELLFSARKKEKNVNGIVSSDGLYSVGK